MIFFGFGKNKPARRKKFPDRDSAGEKFRMDAERDFAGLKNVD